MAKQKNTDTNEITHEECILPLVTLRGLVVTPNANVQVLAARKQSIAAFKSALLSEDHHIAVFCQLYDADESPDMKRLQNTGVVCRVINGDYKDNETFRCLLRGFARIRLIKILDEGEEGSNPEYRVAQCEILREIESDDEEKQHYVTTLQSALEYALKKSDGSVRSFLDASMSSEILETIKKERNLSVLTDILSQTLNLTIQERRLMLETLDPIQRARFLISRLNGYSYQQEMEQRIVEEAKNSMERNQKEYFLNEQMKAIRRELGDEKEETEVEEFRSRLKDLKASDTVKDRIEKEIKKYSMMNIHNSESTMVRSYIEVLLTIPWETSTPLSHDLLEAKEILDNDHYGLTKVKDRILEYLAVQSRSDKLQGPILCLMGPPGIGKTSLGASIARATGRKYARIALGGLHDESEIRGHRRTYLGALPGKIMSNMIKVGVNNPLFLLDEIDKVNSSIHGDPEAALLEVLDPEQNKAFNDNYVEVDYDLSNVLFICTANSYHISEPLLDRMEIIDLSSYTEEEKFNIAKKFLLPKQMRLNTLKPEEFAVTDEAVLELIRYYTHEAGVRGLERHLSSLCRKTVKDMLIKQKEHERKKASSAKSDDSVSENKEDCTDSSAKKSRKIRKITIDTKKIAKLLGPRRYDFNSRLADNKVGLVNGLAWTSLGGDILQLEAVANEGKGAHELTGKLGDVMKESIAAAMTVTRSRSAKLHLAPDFFEKADLHIHVPEGATPKEGPSAGVGMVTAIVSALTGNPVRADVAMTGEITLRGDVLPIGGLKEKLLAALRGGIKTALIPRENEKDLWDIPNNVKKGLKIALVKHIDEVLKLALVNDPYLFIPTTVWRDKPVTAAVEQNTDEDKTTEANA